MAENEQSQKAGEGSTLVQAGGSVSIGLSYTEVKQIIAEERERIVRDVWERAQTMLNAAGKASNPTPLNIVIPILQYASLEQDKTLQERWAALLANTGCSDIHPSFPHVLSRLSSADARFLDGIYDKAFHELESKHRVLTVAHLSSIGPWQADELGILFAELGLTRHPWAMTMGARMAMSLEEFSTQQATLHRIVTNLLSLGLLSMSELDQLREPEKVGLRPSNTFRLTSFGLEFVSACRPPKKAQSE